MLPLCRGLAVGPRPTWHQGTRAPGHQGITPRTQEGTHPPGSQWTRNPIPACAGVYGGFLDTDYQCRSPHPPTGWVVVGTLLLREGLQFPAPGPGLFGFGVRIGGPAVFTFTIGNQHLLSRSIPPNTSLLS